MQKKPTLVLLAERSFDLRTSGLWAQHASAAPLCCVTVHKSSKLLAFNSEIYIATNDNNTNSKDIELLNEANLQPNVSSNEK